MVRIYGTENQEFIKIFEDVFKNALEFIGQKEDVDVELSIVSEEEIRSTNLETRGIDSVTDVLSFPTIDATKSAISSRDYPFDVDPESGKIMLGEIMICLKRAIEQSEEYGHGVDRELGFLFAHGMLHLFGYDHVEESDEIEMRSAQGAILEKTGLTR